MENLGTRRALHRRGQFWVRLDLARHGMKGQMAENGRMGCTSLYCKGEIASFKTLPGL